MSTFTGPHHKGAMRAYTPTTDEVRKAVTLYVSFAGIVGGDDADSAEAASSGFGRWLDAVKAEARAEGAREALESLARDRFYGFTGWQAGAILTRARAEQTGGAA